MAIVQTGHGSDMSLRLKALLPHGWFPDASPVLHGVLAGMAAPLSQSYGAIEYLFTQARLATATDFNLDLIGRDYFGPGGVERLLGETDAHYRVRLQLALLAPKDTRAAVIKAVANVTGITPSVFEPGLPDDTWVWDAKQTAWDSGSPWGDSNLPYQIFVTALTPTQTAKSGVRGWDTGSWDVPRFGWQDTLAATPLIDDPLIYAAIRNVLPINAVAWVKIIPV